MKISRVWIRNFLTIGDSGWLNLQDRGLVLLQGENRDDPSAASNGAGKSSIADAICWALFGETARGETGDAVINNIEKKECSVRLDITDGEITYTIIRNRKTAMFKNSTVVIQNQGGSAVQLHKATERETQDVIEKILGCSKEVFMSAIYAGQELMPDLPGMTDKQLKVLVEEAAGVSRLEKAYEVARSKMNAADASLARVKTELEGVRRRKVAAEFDLASAKLNAAEFESGRKTRRESYETDAQRDAAAAKIANVELRGLGVDDQKRKKAELELQVAGISAERKKVADFYRDKVRPLEKDVNIATVNRNSRENDLRDAISDFKNASEAMKKPCSECGKPHTEDELESFKAHKLKQIKELKDELATAEGVLKDKARSLEVAAAEHVAMNEAVPDTADLMQRIGDIDGLLRHADMLTKLIRDAVARAKQNLKLAEVAGQEANPHELIAKKLVTDIAAMDEKINELTTLESTEQAALEVAKIVSDVFSPAGVRAHILDTVTPFLNDRTAHYLGTLSDGNITAVWSTLARNAKGELREKFGIEVSNAKGAFSFRGLSGGEKRKVRLATMLALQDLVATRASKSIDLWIGDEIDHALDPAGLERLMTILDEKAREKGTVLIISHNRLSDWCDQTTMVIKEGGKSRVEGALAE